jgi:hypothetical protein
VTTNTAKIRRIDKPQGEPILVAQDRLRRCQDEIPDEFWPPAKPKKPKSKPQDSVKGTTTNTTEPSQPDAPSSKWGGQDEDVLELSGGSVETLIVH